MDILGREIDPCRAEGCNIGGSPTCENWQSPDAMHPTGTCLYSDAIRSGEANRIFVAMGQVPNARCEVIQRQARLEKLRAVGND